MYTSVFLCPWRFVGIVCKTSIISHVGSCLVYRFLFIFSPYTCVDLTKIMEALTNAEKYLESARSSPCKVHGCNCQLKLNLVFATV